MREVGAELLCIEQLKALALDLVRALRRITEAHVWLIALIRSLLHNKARGGLKSKSPHVAGPNLADMSLTRSDHVVAATCATQLGQICSGVSLKSKFG